MEKQPSYIVTQNFFNEEQLDGVTKNCEKLKSDYSLVGSERIDFNKRRSKNSFFYKEENPLFFERIEKLVQGINEKYFKFDITYNVDYAQYTKYEPNHYYHWHTDSEMFSTTRKLTVVLMLSSENEYEGNGLELFLHQKINQEKGNIITFPSFIPHRVSKIISGQRKSLVFWFYGPYYK